MRRVMGNSAVTIQVAGVEGIRKALAPWLEPELTKELDVANKNAAKEMAKDLRAQLRPISTHMARAVRVHRAKTGKPGWIVGGKRKIAFFWHMVIGGTKAHGPRKAPLIVFEGRRGVVRTSKVRGVAPRPIVAQVAQRYGERVLDQIDKEMSRVTGT